MNYLIVNDETGPISKYEVNPNTTYKQIKKDFDNLKIIIVDGHTFDYGKIGKINIGNIYLSSQNKQSLKTQSFLKLMENKDLITVVKDVEKTNILPTESFWAEILYKHLNEEYVNDLLRKRKDLTNPKLWLEFMKEFVTGKSNNKYFDYKTIYDPNEEFSRIEYVYVYPYKTSNSKISISIDGSEIKNHDIYILKFVRLVEEDYVSEEKETTYFLTLDDVFSHIELKIDMSVVDELMKNENEVELKFSEHIQNFKNSDVGDKLNKYLFLHESFYRESVEINIFIYKFRL